MATEEMYEVMCLLQGWAPPTYADAIFVPGRAQDDYASVDLPRNNDQRDEGALAAAVRVWHDLKKSAMGDLWLVFPGEDGSYVQGRRQTHGYPGFEKWRNEAALAGSVPSRNILPAPVCSTDIARDKVTTNTGLELNSFVALAQDREWKMAGLAAAAYHMPRVFGTALMAMQKAKYRINLWPILPTVTQLSRSVYGSGGLCQKPRFFHMRLEGKKLTDYIEREYMVSLSEMIAYLTNLRDKLDR